MGGIRKTPLPLPILRWVGSALPILSQLPHAGRGHVLYRRESFTPIDKVAWMAKHPQISFCAVMAQVEWDDMVNVITRLTTYLANIVITLSDALFIGGLLCECQPEIVVSVICHLASFTR